MSTIYCITGYPACGKSLAKRVAEQHGWKVTEMGDLVRDEAASRSSVPVEYNDEGEIVVHDGETQSASEVLREFATSLRESEGADVFARLTEARFQEWDADKILLNGLRSIDEFEYFTESSASDFLLVYIHTPFTKRLELIRQREREGEGEMDAQSLYERDSYEERSWGLDELVDEADRVILNTSDIETFETRVHSLLESGE